jgi:hypothetical protein
LIAIGAEEAGNVLVAVSHPFQPLDFVVAALGDGRGDPPQEEVQDGRIMPHADNLKVWQSKQFRDSFGMHRISPPCHGSVGKQNLNKVG